MKKISDQELLDELKRVKTVLGRVPKQKDLSGNSKYSANAYKRAFGGISAALKLIGERPYMCKHPTRELCISEMNRLYKELNKVPTEDEFDEFAELSYVTFLRIIRPKPTHIFLEEECDIPQEAIDKIMKRNISNEALKNEIIRLKELIGRYPTYYDMVREGKFSCYTYEHRFGTWIEALHALGFTDYISQSVYKNQIHVKGKDGIVYRSNFEARVGDILYQMEIDKKIKSYEYEKPVCEGRTWTCDFYIRFNDGTDLWLELDGMMASRKDPYDASNEKIAYYKAHGLKYDIMDYRNSEIFEKINEILFDEIKKLQPIDDLELSDIMG
jgi:very-short-patch-repair endonuclease